MAERKQATKQRSSGSGSSKRSNSSTRSTRSGNSKRVAKAEEPPSRHSPTGGDHDESQSGMSKSAESKTGGKSMGRPPADEPDVYVFVPQVHVGELNIDVERLEAHLALRAQVANLVNLVAGVHVGVDKVKLDLKDVDAECELKVRLENTYNILDRTLTTLDENPKIIEGLLNTADTAVQETGQVGKEATKPGGAVSDLTSGLGDSLGELTSSVGGSLSDFAHKANPKQLTSGSGSAKSTGGSSNGFPTGKAATAAAASGLIGGLLVRLKQRNGGLGNAASRTLRRAKRTLP